MHQPRQEAGMPTVTQSLEIPATPERVWALATDLSRYGEWNITHSGFPDGPPSAEQGATFTEKITLMGMPGEATWTITESTAPTRTVWSGEGPLGIMLGTRLELAPTGEGTTVSIAVSFEGGPLAGPIGDAVAQSAQKGALESLERLKGLVQS
jgi:carbon monoxide dehydrogenase subunit G